MTALITADLHLSDVERDDYRHTWMREQLPAIINKHEVQHLLVLGDLTEAKDAHRAWLVNQVTDHFSRLANLCPVIILCGNHDYVSADMPYYRFLRHLPNVSWINSPTTKMIRRLGSCLFLPHTSNYKQDWADLDLNSPDWIFTHQTFAGAKDRVELDGIPRDALPQHARVISGDVHVPQTVGQVTYVGAPYLVDFGDDFTPRVLLADKKGAAEVVCEGPQKRLVVLSHKRPAGSRHSSLSVDSTTGDGDIRPDDVLKIQVRFNATMADGWAIARADVRKWADKHEYWAHTVQPLVDQQRMRKERARATPKNDRQLVEAYAKANRVESPTLKVGMKFLDRT